ncbi:MAG: hypothetical protein WAL50_21765, partial [Kineosporiaceae bacterium]
MPSSLSSRSAPAIAPQVVLVSADPQLSDRIAGLAAAAGLPVTVVADPRDLRQRGGAAVVLLGADLTSAVLATAAPVRRRGVIVVALGDVAAQTWQDAVALGAEQVAVLPEAEP